MSKQFNEFPAPTNAHAPTLQAQGIPASSPLRGNGALFTPKQRTTRPGRASLPGRGFFSRWRPFAGEAEIIAKHTRVRENADRVQFWRYQRETLGGRDAPDLLRRASAPRQSMLLSAVRFLFGAAGLVVLFALLMVVVMSAYALMNPLEPETKCFPRAAQEPYCRTQLYWE